MQHPAPHAPLLIISRNLPPVVGGIERLMHRLLRELSAHQACHVIGPRGCRQHLPAGTRVIELPHSPAPLFLALAMLASAWLVLRHRYRAVVAGNGLMSLAALPVRLRGLPVVTFVYGLDIVADNPLYRLLGLPAIRASDAVIACSSNTARKGRTASSQRSSMPATNPSSRNRSIRGTA